MSEINHEDINFIEKPIDKFKEEQKYLLSMPPCEALSHYFAKNKGYKVYRDSMITYKKHKYSVPIRFIGEYLTAIETEGSLNIYYTTDLIATHKISGKLLSYRKSDVKEILASDAMKHKTDEQIEAFIEDNLKTMDIFLE
jgi:hypothetical protein